ncbi:MAG TPA: S8 family serine peptidase [Candidatus Eisenbacteria bacterium]|nr:S8 family serine peptidase [Candidatus Eisenbacteria bacterium]
MTRALRPLALFWWSVALPAVGAAAPSPSPAIVWVRFADHGALERATPALRRAAARATVSARSLARRMERGVGGDLVAGDLPVEPRYVQGLVDRGFRVRVVSRWLNAASVEAAPDRLAELSALPFVIGIEPVARWRRDEAAFDLERATPIVESPAGDRALRSQSAPGDATFYGFSAAQNTLIEADRMHARGLSGAGILIAMLDTGFRTTHVAFDSLRVVAQRDFVHGDSVVANQPGQDQAGQDYHGTETLSVVGSYEPGRLVGTAFRASFALAKTEDESTEFPIEMDWWQAGAEWADSLGADVLSSSLGYTTFDFPYPSYRYADLDGRTTVVTRAAAEAARRGLVVVTAQGNEGSRPWRYLIAPADGDTVCAVGATDSTGLVAIFSSYGPSADGRVKPDVCAMGSAMALASPGDDFGIATASGSSFSTPAVAGICALLLEAHPTWTPFEVIQALRATASRFAAPDTHGGYGVARAEAALSWVPSTAFANVSSQGAALVLAGAAPFLRGGTMAFWARAGAAAGSASVVVFDARGRRVRTLFAGAMLAGSERLLSWDGRDQGGVASAPGVYFVRFEAPSVHLGRRVVLL